MPLVARVVQLCATAHTTAEHASNFAGTGPRAFDESDAEEEGSEEDDGEDEDDEEEEGGGGAARGARPSPFAAADDYSVNLSDLLDDDDDDDVSDDDESDDEGGGDGEAVDLPAQMGGFVRALAAHVGEAGFAQLCAPLSEEERGAVGRLAAGGAG